MSDATDAIKDLQEALNEYGSDIKLRVVTPGVYDPLLGVTYTNVDTNLKAIIKSEATRSTQNAFTGAYESSIMLYSAVEPTKANKILIDGDVYNIVYISVSTLQNINIKYELLVAK